MNCIEVCYVEACLLHYVDRLSRGVYMQKNSCEGNRASTGCSKPTTYATTPCGRWVVQNPQLTQQLHAGVEVVPTLEMHASVEETQRHWLVQAKMHQIPLYCPKKTATIVAMQKSYSSLQVDAGGFKVYKTQQTSVILHLLLNPTFIIIGYKRDKTSRRCTLIECFDVVLVVGWLCSNCHPLIHSTKPQSHPNF
jgi:hypothetical protein